eukprot:scaffold8723_cov116-Isochrysis_galbana.AAC.5
MGMGGGTARGRPRHPWGCYVVLRGVVRIFIHASAGGRLCRLMSFDRMGRYGSSPALDSPAACTRRSMPLRLRAET